MIDELIPCQLTVGDGKDKRPVFPLTKIKCVEDLEQLLLDLGNFINVVKEQQVGKKGVDGGEMFNNCAVNTAINRGHAQNDYTYAGWRSQAENYGTYADNTSHAGGRLTTVTGKCGFGHGIEYTENVLVAGTQVVTTEEIALESLVISVSASVQGVLQLGDFVHLGGSVPSSDNRRIVAISDDGMQIFLDQPYLDMHYTTAVDGQEGAPFPKGASLRKANITEVDAEGAVGFGRAVKSHGKYGYVGGDRSSNLGLMGFVHGFSCENEAEGGFSGGARVKTTGNYGNGWGVGLTVGSYCQTVRGRNNIPDYSQKYLEIVGNSKTTALSNGRTLDWSGNGWYAGNVYVGGTSQDDVAASQLAKIRSMVAQIDDSGAVWSLVYASGWDVRGEPLAWSTKDSLIAGYETELSVVRVHLTGTVTGYTDLVGITHTNDNEIVLHFGNGMTYTLTND